MADFQSVYLPSERWDELLVADASGLPPFRIATHQGDWWLSENTTGKLVNVGNRHLAGLGLWTVSVRGVGYYDKTTKRLDLSPGSGVTLVREPENPYDGNAIAVAAAGETVGYVNKGMAKRLAVFMDDGKPFEAFVLSGSPAGADLDGPLKIVAASPKSVAHIRRR